MTMFSVSQESLKKSFEGKVVCVTGGTGTFGQCFVTWLLSNTGVSKVLLLSRDELKQSVLKSALVRDYDLLRIRFFLGDIRDYERLCDAFQNVDIVVHAAALKQVDTIEYNPFEAVKTNVIGANNVIRACVNCGVKKLLALSTDKAASPGNLYGATKLCQDKLMVASNMMYHNKIKVAVVRYGNVFASRGSVVPIFLEQIKHSKQITLTNPAMTRFSMDAQDAVSFVVMSLCSMVGGEIFVPKLPSYKLEHLAKVMAEMHHPCEVRLTGFRPGEKMHECMIPENESLNTLEYASHYIIHPNMENLWIEDLELHLKNGAKRTLEEFEYNSDTNTWWMTDEEIKKRIEDVISAGGEAPIPGFNK